MLAVVHRAWRILLYGVLRACIPPNRLCDALTAMRTERDCHCGLQERLAQFLTPLINSEVYTGGSSAASLEAADPRFLAHAVGSLWDDPEVEKMLNEILQCPPQSPSPWQSQSQSQSQSQHSPFASAPTSQSRASAARAMEGTQQQAHTHIVQAQAPMAEKPSSTLPALPAHINVEDLLDCIEYADADD